MGLPKMKRLNKRVLVFAAGVSIQMIALFADHIEELPWGMRFIAPAYVHAKAGIAKIERTGALDKTDEGFVELTQIVIDSLGMSPEGDTPIYAERPKIRAESIRVSRSMLSNYGVWARALTVKVSVEPPAYLANDQVPVLLEGLSKEVEERKGPRILGFCIVVFCVGTLFIFLASRMNPKKQGEPVAQAPSSSPEQQ